VSTFKDSEESFNLGVATIDSSESFVQGALAVDSGEPFDILWTARAITSEEPFILDGTAGASSVEPFDLGEGIWVTSEESFNILSADAGGFLGAGSPASPLVGWRRH
jgi:hypothetical protein